MGLSGTAAKGFTEGRKGRKGRNVRGGAGGNGAVPEEWWVPRRSIEKFRDAVVNWFAKNGRDLPWRRTIDPYAILVSEIMCQQTQVATVLPYFERWMRRFPDCDALAAASEYEVLALWQGLGYYSRARNLHRAAQVVAERGGFPGVVEEIRALPGVGRYTAGAVAAFAYDLPEPLVDANIARVLARVFAIAEATNGTAGMEKIWARAGQLQAEAGGRAFNGGLMEIGALICTPRTPGCGECPVAGWCAAKARSLQNELPVKKAGRKTVLVAERCALITRDGRVLLEHQSGSRWRGLWKLPALERIPAGKPIFVTEYPFTHHKVTLSVYRGRPSRNAKPGCEWHAVSAIETVPMAAAHRRALAHLL
jgi:A/G-specific adenine glycosylase